MAAVLSGSLVAGTRPGAALVLDYSSSVRMLVYSTVVPGKLASSSFTIGLTSQSPALTLSPV